MKQEITVTAKTVEAAVSEGAKTLGVEASAVTYEVISEPKKGFLGFGGADAKVKITYTPTPEMTGLAFVKTVIADMGLNAEASISGVPGGKREYLITVSGEDASALIGHHGETLDSLQYLANLAANRREEDEKGGNYTRLTVDVENYRAKREQTLRRLAKRMAEKALKYRRNVALEPMNPYERRIIHSEVQNIKGVTTNSVGTDNNRRVVIYVDEQARAPKKPAKKTASEPSATASERTYTYPKNKIQKRARFDDSLPEYTMGQYMKDDDENEATDGEDIDVTDAYVNEPEDLDTEVDTAVEDDGTEDN